MEQTSAGASLPVWDRGATDVRPAVLASPGQQALLLHRLAHALHRRGVSLLPRLIAHVGRWPTGIEIHPGRAAGWISSTAGDW